LQRLAARCRALPKPAASCRARPQRDCDFRTALSYRVRNASLSAICVESGATAIEYGLIAAGISLAIIAVVSGLGTNLNDKFTSINNSLK